MTLLALHGCAMEMDEPDIDGDDVATQDDALMSGRSSGSGSGKMGMNDGKCIQNCYWEDVSCRIDAGGYADLNRWCDIFDAQCRAKC